MPSRPLRYRDLSRSKTKDSTSDVELGLLHDTSSDVEAKTGIDSESEVFSSNLTAIPTSLFENGSHELQTASYIILPSRTSSPTDIQDVVVTKDAKPNATLDDVEATGRRRDGGVNVRGRDPLSRKRFGINVNQLASRSFQGAPQDYKKKYPVDEVYKEIDSDACVFLVYNDESQIFDNEMVVEAGDNLDILLVFAGLFSAVLTTFVAQTSQSLSPDKADITNSLLREMISLQRAQANGSSFGTIPAADTSFTASRTDIWVNGLWFMSLALSLSTALIAVIAKQWLRQYSSFISGPARTRAFIRQFRYDGLNKWRVPVVIGLLPTFLHISLFMFMAGLVVFLRSLNHTLAYVIAATTGFLCVTYIIMNILPVYFIQCPYRTPLSEILFRLHAAATNFLHPNPNRPRSLRHVERISADNSSRIGDTLCWLVNNTSDPSAKAIVAEAVGSSAFDPMLTANHYNALWGTLDQQWEGINNSLRRLQPDGLLAADAEMHLERLIRATFRHAPIYTAQSIPENLSVTIPSAMFAIATCGVACRFREGDNQWRDLAPYQVFDFLLEMYSDAVHAELRAPTWMWWSICTQAAENHHHQLDYEDIRDICNKGQGNIEAYGIEEWLRGVSLPLRLRAEAARAVNEEGWGLYEQNISSDAKDTGRFKKIPEDEALAGWTVMVEDWLCYARTCNLRFGLGSPTNSDISAPKPLSLRLSLKEKKGTYQMLTKEHMMDIYLAVHIHRNLRSRVNGVSKSAIRTV